MKTPSQIADEIQKEWQMGGLGEGTMYFDFAIEMHKRLSAEVPADVGDVYHRHEPRVAFEYFTEDPEQRFHYPPRTPGQLDEYSTPSEIAEHVSERVIQEIRRQCAETAKKFNPAAPTKEQIS